MPRFIAAANPAFSGSAITRANRAATPALASEEALSTTTSSVETPRWQSADSSESGRSFAEFRATVTIETAGITELSALSSQVSALGQTERDCERPQICAGRLFTASGKAAPQRERREPQRHSRGEEGPVSQSRRGSITEAVADRVRVVDREKTLVAQAFRGGSSAVPEPRARPVEDR